MLLVSPMARSNENLIAPRSPLGAPPLNHPPEGAPDGAKQIRWSPESAAVNVKRPFAAPRCDTTRWSLSNVSSTVIAICIEGAGTYDCVVGSYCVAS